MRAEASRYFTITIKHQPWLGLAALPGHGESRTEELSGDNRSRALGAGSKDDRDKQTDNRVHTTAGDREDVASCSRFPHSALDSGHSGLQDNCELRAG